MQEQAAGFCVSYGPACHCTGGARRERERCVAGGRSAHPHKGCPVCCMVVVSGIVWCICVSGLVRWYLFVYTHSFTGCTDTQTLSRHARRSSNEQHEHYRPHTPFILSARSPAHKHSLPLCSLATAASALPHIPRSLSPLSDSLAISLSGCCCCIARDLHHKHTRDHQLAPNPAHNPDTL